MESRSIAPLERRVPVGDVDADGLLAAFLDHVGELGLELYPAQEEAILELLAGNNVILDTPTGSGKSLVATALAFKALSERRRCFYTAPIKALVSEKFFAMCRDFGADNVGMMTGDATVNRDAPIICCTAEILMKLALRDGAEADVDYVVMDEFHFYADRDRGVAWQVPLLTLPQATFLLMSATLGETSFFEEALTRLTGRSTRIVKSATRPVPLEFLYRETPLHETILELLDAGKAPVYIVHFTQRAAAEQAQALTSIDFLTKPQKETLKEALAGVRMESPWGKVLRRYLAHGVGVHHAGLLPKYRLLVEKLAQRGLLRVICGTDTLGVGVNIPIRTVLFTRLCKFDGEKTKILSVRELKQIAGRAGRKGFDDRGTVVAQAPEHVIENRILRAKAGDDPKKLRKLTLRKAPDRGYVHWDQSTFERLVASEPERLQSSFHVTHGMMLEVLERPDGCRAMKTLIRSCHEGPASKHQIARQSISMFRSLVRADVLELVAKEDGPGKRVRVNADLQSDFSLNQTLSLYVVEALEQLDPESPDYAVDVLTLVESVLENPDVILMKQVDEAKDEAMARMKEAGLEYEERMAELEKIDRPKPRADFVYATFNEFARRHPWVGAENIRPKSVAREMFEQLMSFEEYVKEYDLHRSEGLLLRYLSDAYKALDQNVPDSDKTDAVWELIDWLGVLVRGVDSSLLDEWERLRDPESALLEAIAKGAPPERELPKEIDDVTADERAFTVMVRNEAWRLLRALASRNWSQAAEMIEPIPDEEPWTAEGIAGAIASYFEEHRTIRTDPAARSPANTQIERGDADWRVQQIVVDPDDDLDWVVELRVDLARAREAGRPVLGLVRIGT